MDRGIGQFYTNQEWSRASELFDDAISKGPKLETVDVYDFAELQDFSKSNLKEFARGLNDFLNHDNSLYYLVRSVPGQETKSVYGKIRLEVSFESDYRTETPVFHFVVRNITGVGKMALNLRPEELKYYKISDVSKSESYRGLSGPSIN